MTHTRQKKLISKEELDKEHVPTNRGICPCVLFYFSKITLPVFCLPGMLFLAKILYLYWRDAQQVGGFHLSHVFHLGNLGNLGLFISSLPPTVSEY